MIYSNAINISVIIGSMMADSTKTLQFISVTVLNIIFNWHTGKARLWTLRLWTPGSFNSGLLDSGRWTLERLDNRLTYNDYTFATKGIL